MLSVVWQTLLQSITGNECFLKTFLVQIANETFETMPFTLHIAVAQDVHVQRLYQHLLSEYTPDVRPVVIDGDTLNVTFDFSLTQIIDVVPQSRNYTITHSLRRMNEGKC